MGRSPCCDKNGLKKGPWTPEEDLKLMQYIQVHGPGNWRTLPKNAGLQRCGKSCRLRWTNYLRPDIKRGRFSFEEEETIIQLHSVLGNKWSAIAARLPGRTDNEIKNYWNTHIRKRLLRMGIDPVTHSPRLDLLDLSSLLNSAQLSLSSLLGLQTLVNPEVLRLAATLLASNNNENPEMLLQKLQEDQILNAQMQNQNTDQIFQPNDQIQNPVQEVPPCTTSNVSCSPYLNQTPSVQGNPEHTTSNVSCSSYLNQTQSMQGTPEQFSMNSDFSGSQTFKELLMSSNANLLSPQNYGYCISDQIPADVSENSAFHSLNDSSNQSSQKFSFDSVLSTPLSGSPLNSSSTFINSSSTEDERESYCSNMMKFEIPASLDFDDFM